MSIGLHDILQWGALATLLGTLWWRVRQRDSQIIAEAERRAAVEHRLSAIERRFEAHKIEDSEIHRVMTAMAREVHEIRERIVRIETRLEARG